MFKKFIEWMKSLFSKKQVPPVEYTIPEKPVEQKPKLPIDLDKFLISIKASQRDGYYRIINKFYELGLSDLRHLAYCLATALHETAHTMMPITEYDSADGSYLRSKPYWPFVGRGYVQLTWDFNYEKYGIKDNPEKALDPDFAAFILIDGMTKGTFTSRKLSEFFSDTVDNPVGARRIVNGTDKDQLIAGYHREILAKLKLYSI